MVQPVAKHAVLFGFPLGRRWIGIADGGKRAKFREVAGEVLAPVAAAQLRYARAIA